jgi:hypothetical protein
LFGPIVLIAIGLFFLFNRLNFITDLHWGDVIRLWPLFLIFLGLNILVQQAPRPFGTLLSGIVALLAVGVFGYILVVGVRGSLFGGTFTGEWQTQEISFPAVDLNSAVLDIEIGPPGAEMFALEDSRELIAGTVTYNGDLTFNKQGSNGMATVTLAPHNYGGWIWEPGEWDSLQDEARWNLGLNRDVPMSLRLTALAGSSRIDLRDLLLQDLSLNISAGEVILFLPSGNYDVDMETNAASTTMTLPQAGRQTIDLSVNAGSVTIELPEGVEVRVEMDQALGSFNSQDGRLQRIGDSNVWQTAGYDRSSDRIELNLNVAVGSVTVR